MTQIYIDDDDPGLYSKLNWKPHCWRKSDKLSGVTPVFKQASSSSNITWSIQFCRAYISAFSWR